MAANDALVVIERASEEWWWVRHSTTYAEGFVPAAYVQAQAPASALGLDYGQYCQYMQESGEQLTESDLRRRFDDINSQYQQSYDSYDQFITGGAGAGFAPQQSYTRKGGAYNFRRSTQNKSSPLIEFLRWQEWYVEYCKLRNIGQHAYK